MARKLTSEAKKLIKEFGLIDDPKDPNSDVFHSPRFSIITRAGIDKITHKANISMDHEIVYATVSEVVVKGTYSAEVAGKTKTVSTLGESSIDEVEVVTTTSTTLNKGAAAVIKKSIADIDQLVSNLSDITPPASPATMNETSNTHNEYYESLRRLETGLRTYTDILDAATSVALERKDEVQRVTTKKGNVTSTDRNGEPIPNYRWAMAEKRANSRGVLKLLGFYELGFFGQDEADDFDKVVKEGSSMASNLHQAKTPTKKGTTGTEVSSKMISA